MHRAGAEVDDDDIVWEPMAPDEQVRPFVQTGRGWKSLHFSISAIQSRMRTGRPDALDLEYTRLMMGFLLFVAEPRRLVMVGLGGGSMVKFIHRHLSLASLDVVEINRHVVALRDEFDVPRDDERLRVITADGAGFVEHAEAGACDVLLVDAFDTHGMPQPLSTPRFYDACRRLLAPDGLFVVNLQAGDPLCPVHVDRIATAFDGNLLRVDAGDHSNSVVFAGPGRPLRQARRLARGNGLGESARVESIVDDPSKPLPLSKASATGNDAAVPSPSSAAWQSLANDFARIDRALAAGNLA
jgi:spermidine synthase